MRTVLASAVVLAGAGFMLVAALGLVRLPDLYTRMQAGTKASTVGVVALMGGVAVAAWELPVTIRVVLVGAFFLLTSPVAAHAIARSAHTRGVPLAPGTRVDRGEREERPGAGRPDGLRPRRPQHAEDEGEAAEHEAAGEEVRS
jgi:multicomponent Na+:H+ antiporter subunit G